MADALLIAARALHYAAVVQLAGAFLFACLVAAPARRIAPDLDAAIARTLRVLAWTSLLVAIAAGAGLLVLQAAAMSGEPPAAVLFDGTLATVLSETRLGRVAELRAALAVLAVLALALPGAGRRSGRRWVLLCLAAGLLGSTAWMGHGAAVPGAAGDFHLAADVVHLLAAGAWVGALLPFALLLAAARRAPEPGGAAVAGLATRRFATLGYFAVGALLASGLVNVWFLTSGWASVIGTLYGRLLLAKVALYLVMVGIAAVNRFRIAPRLGRTAAGAAPARALQRNSLIELGLGLGIIAIVAVLGMLPPATHFMPP